MAELPYASIVVTGDDARDFLQNQLTQDITPLGDDHRGPLLAAWCNPKGRVITLLGVSWTGDGFALCLPTELAESVVKRLTMYRFRSKVGFEIRAATAAERGENARSIDALRNGIVHIGVEQSEDFTPHMLNLDLLGAVSLDKGCYPGQEIVARTHYRGATKRRLFRFESSRAVAVGDAIEDDGGKAIGEVVNAIGNDLLAVVPVAQADDALSAGDATLTRKPLPCDAAD